PLFALTTALAAVVGGPALFVWWHARRITKLGYGQHDVDYAFQAELQRSREERAFEYGTRPSGFERVWQGVALFGTTLGLVAMSVGHGALTTLGGVLFSIGGLSAIVVIIRAQRRSDFGGTLWPKFLKGRRRG